MRTAAITQTCRKLLFTQVRVVRWSFMTFNVFFFFFYKLFSPHRSELGRRTCSWSLWTKPNLPLFNHRPRWEMDFQNLLLKAGNALGQEEVRALIFLCTDLLGRNPDRVHSASHLFSCLSDQDYLSEARQHLLHELLNIIKRTQLLRELRLTCNVPTNLVSPYRCGHLVTRPWDTARFEGLTWSRWRCFSG